MQPTGIHAPGLAASPAAADLRVHPKATSATPGVRRAVRWHVVAAVVAVTAGAALRLAPHPSGLWLDELYTAWAADPTAPFVPAFWQRMAPDFQPPGYYPLMWAWHALVGTDAPASRLAGGLGVTLAVPLTGAVLRGVLPGRAVAAVAAVLALAWPGVFYAHEARAYAALYALACVGYALVLRAAVRGPDARGRAGVVFVALLAGSLHFYGMVLGGALLAAQAIATLAGHGWRSALEDAACGAAVGAVYVAVLVWQHPLQTGTGAGWLSNDWAGIGRSYVQMLAPDVGFALALGVLAVAAQACRASPFSRPASLAIAAGLGVSVAVPVAVTLIEPVLAARYLIITVPPLLIWAAARAAGGGGHLRMAVWMGVVVTLAAADARAWMRFAKEDWRAGAALVAAHHRPGCAVSVWHWWPGVYAHYLPLPARADVQGVPADGPVSAPAPGCRVWLWAGHPNTLTLAPPPGARVVRLYGQQIWLAPGTAAGAP